MDAHIRRITRHFSRPTADGGHLHTAAHDDASPAHIGPYSPRCGWCAIGAPHSTAEHERAQALHFEATIGDDRFRGAFERGRGLVWAEKLERTTGEWFPLRRPERLAQLAEMAEELAR